MGVIRVATSRTMTPATTGSVIYTSKWAKKARKNECYASNKGTNSSTIHNLPLGSPRLVVAANGHDGRRNAKSGFSCVATKL
jgi:hypothetical protein